MKKFYLVRAVVMLTFRGMQVEECFYISALVLRTELNDELFYN